MQGEMRLDQIQQGDEQRDGHKPARVAAGRGPEAAVWAARLTAGYTTDEQRSATAGGAASSSRETTFF